jgi:hypothetical protein
MKTEIRAERTKKDMQVIGISEGDRADTVKKLIEIDDAVVWAKRPALPLSTVQPLLQPPREGTPQYLFGINIRPLKQFIP